MYMICINGAIKKNRERELTKRNNVIYTRSFLTSNEVNFSIKVDKLKHVTYV